MSSVKIGIIGAGNIATNMHIPVLRAMPGVELSWLMDANPARAEQAARARTLRSTATMLISRLGLRAQMERLLPLLPLGFTERVRADFMAARASGEIAALTPSVTVANAAAWRPTLDLRPIEGTRATLDVIKSDAFPGTPPGKAWPAELDGGGGGRVDQ